MQKVAACREGHRLGQHGPVGETPAFLIAGLSNVPLSPRDRHWGGGAWQGKAVPMPRGFRELPLSIPTLEHSIYKYLIIVEGEH